MKRRNLTKRIAVIAMTTAMALGLIACGNKSKTSGDGEGVTQVSSTTQSSKEETQASAENNEVQESSSEYDWPYMEKGTIGYYVVESYKKCEDLTKWGNYQRIRTDKSWVYIKFPSLIPTGHNYVAYQSDDTVVIFAPSISEAFADEITDAESILNVAMNHQDDYGTPVPWMSSYWHLYGDDKVTMTIDSSSTETVGHYECGHYTGTATYTDERSGEEKNIPFAGYATFTKGTNEPIYWLVFDVSEDKSLGATIEDYAKKMGYTLVDDPDER